MVYVFLGDGFEEVEALTPIDLLRRVGAEVTTVSVGCTREVAGAHGVTVLADRCHSESGLDYEDVEMVILPGGMPGTANLDKSAAVDLCLEKALQKDCWIGAICAAPSVLGKRGLLNGRRATCFPGFEEFLTGAEYTGAAVERDGRFITAKGAGAALEFALELVSLRNGAETARELRESLQCPN